VYDVENHKRSDKLDVAEELLLELINAIEEEAKVKNWGVAPWYYDELAKIYRKKKNYVQEVAILERFAEQKHAPGMKPAKLLNV
jgi:hypothetical protein